MDFGQLATAVANNGIGIAFAAAALWFAYYRETKTIPKLMESFGAAMKISQDSFSDRHGKTLDTFAQLSREERSLYQKWHDENREALGKVLEETKENRHTLRDLAHQMGLKKAMDELRAKQDAAQRGDDE